MDTITVQLENIVIKLPETHLIVAKEDYRKLQEQASEGQYWTLSDVLSLLSVSSLGYLITSSTSLKFVLKSILRKIQMVLLNILKIKVEDTSFSQVRQKSILKKISKTFLNKYDMITEIISWLSFL